MRTLVRERGDEEGEKTLRHLPSGSTLSGKGGVSPSRKRRMLKNLLSSLDYLM